MSARRIGAGYAEFPNRPQNSHDSEFFRRYLDAPTISGNKNFPDDVASGGTDFVQEDSPWGRSTDVVSEEDLYAMDLSETKEMFDTTSPSSSGFVQSKRSWQTSTEGVVSIEEHTLPDMHSLAPVHVNGRIDPFSTNLSSVCSGLEYPITSKAGSSMDTDAGGAAVSQCVLLQRELVPLGMRHDGIRLTLLDRECWEELFRHGNEMMIRPVGCCMSPSLQFTISGLDKTTLYSIFLEFPMQDNYCRIYRDQTWKKIGRPVEQKLVPVVEHWRSPSPGDVWMNGGVDFEYVNISNRSCTDYSDVVCLETNHAYLPRINLRAVDKSNQPIMGKHVSVSFQETAFITVCGPYKNPQVRKLKSSLFK